jgi:hypothetical protein
VLALKSRSWSATADGLVLLCVLVDSCGVAARVLGAIDAGAEGGRLLRFEKSGPCRAVCTRVHHCTSC